MKELLLFKSFYEMDEAENLRDFLLSKGIHCKIEKSRVLLDTVYIGHTGDKTILLLMAEEDFEKANNLIDEEVSSRIGEIGPDYYLHDMSDEELADILRKPDEWNNQDVLIAKSLLEKRGRTFTEADLQHSKETRTMELAKPQTMSPAFLLLSYALTLWLPLYGIFFALLLLNSTSLLPNGKKIKAYSPATRTHGWILLLISVTLSFYLYAQGYIVSSSLIREPVNIRIQPINE
ncbi:MAG: hypothetical protein EOO09_11070 [Chitinophagaceae bacterium]|nr:MAG: hypothetical protein EOO09_11070 [Chitinophagaceae bacterium]